MRAPDVVSITQLNEYIKSLFEGNEILSHIYVTGEISNFTHHIRTGHLYMTLKDENAAIKAVMFRGSAQRLRFQPQSGMKVLARGRVSVYPRDGQYQLYIDDMQPEGAGAYYIAYEQLKDKLSAEGLFAPERKRPLPPLPARIAVLTSPTGAAVQDILSILKRRFPLTAVILFPVQVQGEAAAADLTKAVVRCNETQAADLIIIGRGGGSIEDLWAFNDELLARAIAASTIPVISAVGHETDYTICDFVADCRAPTPSAAAELAAPDRYEQMDWVRGLHATLRTRAKNQIEQSRFDLQTLTSHYIFKNPLQRLQENRLQLDAQTIALTQATRACLLDKRHPFENLCAKLDTLSPLRVFARGYSLALHRNKVLSSMGEVQAGDTILVKLQDGDLDCTVQEIIPNVNFQAGHLSGLSQKGKGNEE